MVGLLYAFLANETRLAITLHSASFSDFDSDILDKIIFEDFPLLHEPFNIWFQGS